MNRKIRKYHVSFVVALPPMVRRLLLGSIAVYCFQLLTMHRWDHLFGLDPTLVMSNGAVWQLVTYIFLHANPLHLFWNMIVLWMFGAELEIIWGSRRLVSYYILCGAGAGLFAILLDPRATTITVGASGAIFGLLLAFGLTFPERPIAFMLIFPIKAKYFVAVLGALQLFLFVQDGDGGIAYGAHIGGLLTGGIFLWIRQKGWRGLRKIRIVRSSRSRHLRVVPPLRGAGSDDIQQGYEDSASPEKDIDKILDKISALGLRALTDRERTLLEEASKNLGSRREEED